MRTTRTLIRLLLCAAVPLACAEPFVPEADETTQAEREFTAAFFGFDYAGRYEGTLEITLDVIDLDLLQAEFPPQPFAHAWVRARFVQGTVLPECIWLSCPITPRWWILIEAYSPTPAPDQPRLIELRIPAQADGSLAEASFSGTYEFACRPRDQEHIPECIWAPSIRDKQCARPGTALWCSYPDNPGHIWFDNIVRFADGSGWTGEMEQHRVSSARVTIEEPVRLITPLTAVKVNPRLRGSFNATLSDGTDDTVQVTGGRFDLEVRY